MTCHQGPRPCPRGDQGAGARREGVPQRRRGGGARERGLQEGPALKRHRLAGEEPRSGRTRAGRGRGVIGRTHHELREET